jgi:hypothetical protein
MTMHHVIPVTVELVQSDLHRMPSGDRGGREIAVHMVECGTVSVGFCGFVLKYFFWRQLCDFKIY